MVEYWCGTGWRNGIVEWWESNSSKLIVRIVELVKWRFSRSYNEQAAVDINPNVAYPSRGKTLQSASA
jgi:hypothetical protein